MKILTINSLRFPVATCMIFSAVILLGTISFLKLPVALLPDIEFPEITVVTEFDGASPEEIESLVTRPLEESLASVSGVRDVSSVSTEGYSIIRLKFSWGKRMDLSAMEVREKADLVRGSLPQDTRRPIVLKYNPSDQPLMALSITGKADTPGNLRSFIEKEVVPQLHRADGVASVEVTGGAEREIAVDVDLAALSSRNLGLQEVMDSLASANYGYPAGTINREGKDYPVRVEGEFKNLQDMEQLILFTGENGAPVRLKDVANVRDGLKERTAISRFNGKEDVNLLIRKESLKNTVTVCGELRKKIDELNSLFGKRIDIEILQAQDNYIIQSNRNLLFAAILGGTIAFGIIFLFLRDMIKSLIIAISIPISVMFVFIFMNFKGITLNMISLGGLAIGIGMLVDNAIVVMESVERKLVLGGEILEGVSEISGSVTGSTFTTVVVFFPVVFVKGIAGAVFGQLAFVISISLIASLLVSLTLIPLLIKLTTRSVGLSLQKSPNLPSKSVFSFDYQKFLIKIIPFSKEILILGPVLVLAGILLFFIVKKEMLPGIDTGQITLRLESAEGIPLETMAAISLEIEHLLLAMKGDIRKTYSLTGFDEKNIIRNRTERLKPNVTVIQIEAKKGRTASVMERIQKQISLPPEVAMTIYENRNGLPGFSSVSANDRSILIRAIDKKELQMKKEKVLTFLKNRTGISRIIDESGSRIKELRIVPDREAMAALSVETKLAAETMQAAIRGRKATVFRLEDDDIDIKVRLSNQDRNDPKFLDKMLIKTGIDGVPVPLSAFTKVMETETEEIIQRENQQKVARISFQNEKKEPIKFTEANEIFEEGLDPDTKGSIRNLLLSFILSVVLVYMILASLFESLRKPLVIMGSTPLLIPGAMIGLLLTGKSINIISAIGFVMLAGIVVNNAIVLFESISNKHDTGMGLTEAVIKGSSERLRPVFMTTLTTVLGLLPVALGIGSGNELQSPMAVTVIAGLVFSTGLTLVYLPLLYLESEKVKG